MYRNCPEHPEISAALKNGKTRARRRLKEQAEALKNQPIIIYTAEADFAETCMNRLKKPLQVFTCSGLVEEGGFEPPKSLITDLQSAPFGHSGTPPY